MPSNDTLHEIQQRRSSVHLASDVKDFRERGPRTRAEPAVLLSVSTSASQIPPSKDQTEGMSPSGTLDQEQIAPFTFTDSQYDPRRPVSGPQARLASHIVSITAAYFCFIR
jgi:hypothetical protein